MDARHGAQDKPLIVSEYGILFNEELGFGYERVRDFLVATFDYFRTATDPEIGYPSDGGRLVQRWAWYSLDDDSFAWGTTWSNLYDPTTKEIEGLGERFRRHILDNNLITPYHDLQPVTLTLQTGGPLAHGQATTPTLRSRVANWGNSATSPFVVSFSDGEAPLGERIVPDGLAPRYEGQIVVETAWTDPLTTPHTFHVLADSALQVEEWNEDNNEALVGLDVDLAIGQLRISVAPAPPGQTADITFTATISNTGDVAVQDIVFGLQQDTIGRESISTTTVAVLEPRASQDVSLTWPHRPAGTYSVLAVVDPGNLIIESDEETNEAQGTALVAACRILLPLVARNGAYSDMLDWVGIGLNALWVVGLALCLAAFSYADWCAHRHQVPRRKALSAPKFLSPLSMGLALISTSLFFSAGSLLERAFWAGWGLLLIGESLFLWRRVDGQTDG